MNLTKIKALYIFNKQIWPELLPQMEAINKVGSPYLEVEADYQIRTFEEIPFVSDLQNTPNSYLVDIKWLGENILPHKLNGKGEKYDVIFFHMPSDQWKGGDENACTYPRGATGFDTTIVTIHSHPGELLWNNPKFDKPFFERGQHELGHVMCDLLQKADMTHIIEAEGNLWKQAWFDYLGLTKPEDQKMGVISKGISLIRDYLPFLKRQIDSLEDLVDAIIIKESGDLQHPDGNDNAFNPNDVTGPAYGCLQIHEEYLADVNKSWGSNILPSQLLGDRELSKRVFWEYMALYANKQRLGRDATPEDMARIHNGGPMGYMNPKTIGYWNDVKRIMNK